MYRSKWVKVTILVLSHPWWVSHPWLGSASSFPGWIWCQAPSFWWEYKNKHWPSIFKYHMRKEEFLSRMGRHCPVRDRNSVQTCNIWILLAHSLILSIEDAQSPVTDGTSVTAGTLTELLLSPKYQFWCPTFMAIYKQNQRHDLLKQKKQKNTRIILRIFTIFS